MKRLTNDDPKNNLENALNLFYAKDGEAWVRGGGPEPSYEDVTLFVFIRRVIKALCERASCVDEIDNDTLSEIMFDWLQDGPESIPGVIALLYESAWAFAEIRARLAAYEDLEMTPDDIEQQLTNFSSFLMEMTGGRMSKTNYTVQAMVSEANDYFESVCDECSDRQALAEIEKELEKVKQELIDERHRHDRLQDFEVAEAQELAGVKQERDILLKQLRDLSACDTCKHETKEAEEEPCCSCCNCVYGTTLSRKGEQNNWEWRGAEDTNVPSKEEELP